MVAVASQAVSGIGVILRRGDAGVGAGTVASKTVGTSNQLIKVSAKTAGTAGNSKTLAIVVAGVSTAFSIVVTSSSVVINSATDGSSVATTTVDHAIAQLYANATFQANFDASTTGNGTGVLVASGASALSGGTAGAEVFTDIAEVIDPVGPEVNAAPIDVTSTTSPGYYREYIIGMLDTGNTTFMMNFINDTTQQQLIADAESRIAHNYQMLFPLKSGNVLYTFAALCVKVGIASKISAALQAAVTLKGTGPITRT